MIRPKIALGLRGLVGAAVLISLSASGPAADTGVTTSHGFATFGALKYRADFKHYDYVNPDAPKGGTYRTAVPGYYDSFNSFSAVGFAPLITITGLYDQIMVASRDEPASYYCLICETISYPEDLSWVEFKIRPQAKFSDGTPITPEDVLFSLEAVKGVTVRPTYKRIAAAVTEAVKTGPRSVRFTLAQKGNPTLVTTVGQLLIVPAHFYKNRDFMRDSLDVPVGSGPYKIGKFNPGRWVQLDLRDDYWGKDLPVNKGRYNMNIRSDYYRDATIMDEAFLAGDYDSRLDSSALKWIKERNLPALKRGDLIRAQSRYATPISYQGLILNTRNPFFKDRRVRQAMIHAFDYEWFQKNILYGYHGRVTNYFENSEFDIKGAPGPGELALLEPWRAKLPPEVFGDPVKLPVMGTRAKLRDSLLDAAALLKQAGYRVQNMRLVDNSGTPVELDLMLGYGVTQERYISQFVRNLDRLGIQVNIKLYDNSTVRQLTARYEYDMRISMPNIPVLITPGSEMRNEFASDGVTRLDSRNLAGVNDPVVDDMLKQVETATEREQVVDAMRALNRVLVWGYYTIPMQHVYPAPTGVMPYSYWNKFGRPAREGPIVSLLATDTWWIDKEKEAALRKRLGKAI